MKPMLTLKKDRAMNSGLAVVEKAGAKNKRQRKRSRELARAREWVESQIPPFPFVIGINDQLQKRRPDDVKPFLVGYVIRQITSSFAYLSAFEGATHRHGLDGEVVALAEEHRQFAAGRLYERKVWRQRQNNGQQKHEAVSNE